MAKPKARTEAVNELRQQIKDLKDVEGAEKIYDKIEESSVINDDDRKALHVELQTKVNEVEQAGIDDAQKRGDKEGAEKLINREDPPQIDEQGKPIENQRPLRNPDAGIPKKSGKPITVPAGCKTLEIPVSECAALQEQGKLVGFKPIEPASKGEPITRGIAIIKACVAAFALIFSLTNPSFAAQSTDEAVLGNDRWSVENDGDLVPNTDSSFDLGKTGAELAAIYTDSLVLGGSTITSVGQIVSPWTDGGLTTTLNAAPTKFIATHSSGDFFATGFTVGTGDITFAEGGKIDGDTANEIRLIENSDTLKIGFSGDDITLDTTDGGVIFQLTDATDGTVDFMTNNDTDDYIQISTSSNQSLINFVGQNGKITAASGTIDFDNENLTTTGTLSSGATTVTSLIIGDETFSVPTDDTIRIASNDAQTIWEVYTPGTSDEDAVLRLSADASADNGDDWQFVSDGGTNSLLFQNDTSGSQATIMTLSTAGLLTLTGNLTLSNAEVISQPADDIVRIASNDSSIGLRLLSPNTTDGDASIEFVGDNGADATDSFRIINDSSAASLLFQNDTSVAGTFVTITTMEADGDWVFGGTTPYLTIGDAGAEDAGIVFDGHSGGFDWHISNDDSADDLVIGRGSAPDTTDYVRLDGGSEKMTLGQGSGDADTLLVFNGTAQDFYVALDDSADDLVIGLGSTAGTTPAISIDENQMVTFHNDVITLGDGETISNATDDTVLIQSNDAAIVLSLLSPNTSDGDATLRLSADNSADNGDDWEIQHDGATNNLVFQNDTSGSQVAKLTITTAGVMTSALGTVHTSEAATALTPGTTVSLTVSAGRQVFTDTITTDNQDQTINASGSGSAGDEMIIIFTTDAAGSADEVITFGTNFLSTGTLTLANAASDKYVVTFISDGTQWLEKSRTAIQVTA